ncbi:MMS19 nucleotide excision repair protein homolog isoform X2 [Alnus glutinosa]|uniref:MMS19 nucleotide excision repair protein homolog isoform X2 n=1 Tax=Alnus glutinosa TaxID=3517 RepID=UPI002D766CF6|nr:MMS19 nucleotide excision repair protein homolog isoform X2 [Alnus glutinosa]
MTEPSQLSQLIESFVDSSRSPSQQAASLDTIASLVKNDVLTMQELVKEMEMYLTVTDNVLRARGILLLGEVVACLPSKPLDNTTIHSLMAFFTNRLADWKALRGALVGCLALMRRKSTAGMVTGTDAKAAAQSYLQNLQVQSLGQHDRKLCFELLECLLERYPSAVAPLGDELVYGICEAIDSEKDPQCLMLTFHIVEILVRLFPDPSGPLASFAGDLFEILGCYFPIHFTHPKGEDLDIKRDDLARALMLAFSSTPLFEPFAIPLLLEKLSSSLPFAKVDSLKYLNDCTLKYGAEGMAKHAEAIWLLSIKDAIYTSLQGPALSFTSEYLDSLGFQENEIAREALALLQQVIMQNNGLFLGLIIKDEDINMILNTVTDYERYNDIPSQGKLKLYAVGCILSISTKSSITSCNRVFESFFPRLMEILGLSVRNSSGVHSPNDNHLLSKRLNFGVLYLCVELLSACRDLIAGSKEISSQSVSACETCYCMLQSFSTSLTKAFCSTLATSPHDAHIHFGVKGLQILATFPGDVSPIPISEFENILNTFMSIITVNFSETLIWKLALKALVNIGSFIDRYHESKKFSSYMGIVVEKIVSLVSLDDLTMPFPLKLEAISGIGTSGLNYMLNIVQGLEEAIYANIFEVYVHGNLKSAEITVRLLECYSNKVLPWIHDNGDFEGVLLRFPVNIWNQIESCVDFSVQVQEKELLDAMMTAMRHAVAFCTEESQNKIIQKAYSILALSTSFSLKEFTSLTIPSQLDWLQLTQRIDNLSHRDEWILLLFASVVIAVRPQTHIPDVKGILYLFMTTLLKGYIPAAQALGSMVNKMGKKSSGSEISSDCTLEEALDIIFQMKLWNPHNNAALMSCSGMTNGSEMGDTDLCLSVANNRLPQIHAIAGLSWIGKGLLLRGHEKVKDVTMIFLEFLLSNNRMDALSLKHHSLEKSFEQDLHPSTMKSAADAFHILMSDSEVCLNRKFHAIIRPLYKQRFFSTMMPILQPLIMKNDSSFSRSMLYRAFAHIISDTPLIAILSEAKLLPILLDCLSMLNKDIQDKHSLYSLLLVLSGILTDKNGQEAVIENAHLVVNCLTGLISYPHKMLVRETAIQCLVAMSELPHARIYPMRIQVLRAISKALDDPKSAVRQEAVRCRQAWASLASGSLLF